MKRSPPKRASSRPNWKNKRQARCHDSCNALFQLLLIALVEIMAIQPAKATNIPRQSVNADIISLEEYGIVFKPGRLMSTSDVTHIQQGFVIEIPRRERRTEDTIIRRTYQGVRGDLYRPLTHLSTGAGGQGG